MFRMESAKKKGTSIREKEQTLSLTQPHLSLIFPAYERCGLDTSQLPRCILQASSSSLLPDFKLSLHTEKQHIIKLQMFYLYLYYIYIFILYCLYLFIYIILYLYIYTHKLRGLTPIKIHILIFRVIAMFTRSSSKQ
jgi:hypothetical protein